MTRVKLSGFRELDHALAQLPKAVARNTLRRIGKEALEPMAAIAAARAPVDEGNLALSIAVSEQRTRRASRGGRDPKTSIEIAMGPAGGFSALPYASFVEFGTVDTPAQPYMRPAFDQEAEATIKRLQESLAKEITKAATAARTG